MRCGAGSPDADVHEMLFAYRLEDEQLHPTEIRVTDPSGSGSLTWLDIVSPSTEELAAIEAHYKVEFGSLEELKNTESSARYFQRGDNELHVRAQFLNNAADGANSASVEFVLIGAALLSAHGADLPSLQLIRERITSNGMRVRDAKDLLLEMFATDAEYSADVLEDVHRHLKGASKAVLTRPVTDKLAAAVLARIAAQEDLNGNVRHNISDTRRALSFLSRERLLDEQQSETARQIRRDLDSLDTYTAFLFEKINFLMDATVGFVNVTQNNVIKMFSVAAVAMLPPTLIASIYGMNFEHMPELKWLFGYPFALGLMVISVALPFWWFRRRGWLK